MSFYTSKRRVGAEKGKALDTGMNIAARHIKQLKDQNTCDGVHIMAIGKEEKVPDIMAAAGLDSADP